MHMHVHMHVHMHMHMHMSHVHAHVTCNMYALRRYVWCQGCGHGGHVDCLRGWFGQCAECPAGCGHRCQLSAAPPRGRDAV